MGCEMRVGAAMLALGVVLVPERKKQGQQKNFAVKREREADKSRESLMEGLALV